jgi:hypothetical protein
LKIPGLEGPPSIGRWIALGASPWLPSALKEVLKNVCFFGEYRLSITKIRNKTQKNPFKIWVFLLVFYYKNRKEIKD